MIVDFAENFWGEKNNGFAVLYQNMKNGQVAVKEFSDFLKERAVIEEEHGKHLQKLLKQTSTFGVLGSFGSVWQTLRGSVERVSGIHSAFAQKLQELLKDVHKYGDEQRQIHKQAKDRERPTYDSVNLIQTTTTCLQKAKETYTLRCVELEKAKRENATAKDIAKAEVKAKKAGEEYRQLVEKCAKVRVDFIDKMTKTCQNFQETEENHLVRMVKFVVTFADHLEHSQLQLTETCGELKSKVEFMKTGDLLGDFVTKMTTGRDKPEAIAYEEPDINSLFPPAPPPPSVPPPPLPTNGTGQGATILSPVAPQAGFPGGGGLDATLSPDDLWNSAPTVYGAHGEPLAPVAQVDYGASGHFDDPFGLGTTAPQPGMLSDLTITPPQHLYLGDDSGGAGLGGMPSASSSGSSGSAATAAGGKPKMSLFGSWTAKGKAKSKAAAPVPPGGGASKPTTPGGDSLMSDWGGAVGETPSAVATPMAAPGGEDLMTTSENNKASLSSSVKSESQALKGFASATVGHSFFQRFRRKSGPKTSPPGAATTSVPPGAAQAHEISSPRKLSGGAQLLPDVRHGRPAILRPQRTGPAGLSSLNSGRANRDSTERNLPDDAAGPAPGSMRKAGEISPSARSFGALASHHRSAEHLDFMDGDVPPGYVLRSGDSARAGRNLGHVTSGMTSAIRHAGGSEDSSCGANGGEVAIPPPPEPPFRRKRSITGILRWPKSKEKQRKEKSKSGFTEINGSKDKEDNDAEWDVDEEGYRVRRDTGLQQQHDDEHANSSSDDESDETEQRKKFNITIKPADAVKQMNASTDDLRCAVRHMNVNDAFGSLDPWSTAASNNNDAISASSKPASNFDFLAPNSNSNSGGRFANFSSTSTVAINPSPADHVGTAPSKSLPMHMSKSFTSASQFEGAAPPLPPGAPPALPARAPLKPSYTGDGLFSASKGFSYPLTQITEDQATSVFSQAPMPTESSGGGVPALPSRPRPRSTTPTSQLFTLSGQQKRPLSTNSSFSGFSATSMSMTTAMAGGGGGSNEDGLMRSDSMASFGDLDATIGAFGAPNSHLNLSSPQFGAAIGGETIPLAVNVSETVHAMLTNSTSESLVRCKTFGAVTISFPANGIGQLLAAAATNGGQLAFQLTNAAGRIQAGTVRPIPGLLLAAGSGGGQAGAPGSFGGEPPLQFQFVMPSLCAQLRALFEANPAAPYHNLKVLDYEVSTSSTDLPLLITNYWKCEATHTDIRIDYRYNSDCSLTAPLLNLQFLIAVDGSVSDVQSQPTSTWCGVDAFSTADDSMVSRDLGNPTTSICYALPGRPERNAEKSQLNWRITEVSKHADSAGSLKARLTVSAGPSTPKSVAVAFQANDVCLSSSDFELICSGYRLSLVKKRLISGKYTCEPERR